MKQVIFSLLIISSPLMGQVIDQSQLTEKFYNPETGEEDVLVNTIYVTNKETDVFYGNRICIGPGKFDYSDLVDITPGVTDFRKGMEVISMTCYEQAEYMPVRFKHDGVGEYYGVWIKREDLDFVLGPRALYQVSDTYHIQGDSIETYEVCDIPILKEDELEIPVVEIIKKEASEFDLLNPGKSSPKHVFVKGVEYELKEEVCECRCHYELAVRHFKACCDMGRKYSYKKVDR